MSAEITSKMRIHKSAAEIFEAIVDPAKTGNYWFTSSSQRWEQGKTITVRYEEYNAEGNLFVDEIVENEKIVFSWDIGLDEKNTATILFKEDNGSTIVEITESGFDSQTPDKMIGQKEGWVYMLTCLKASMENGISTLRASLIH